MKHGMLRYLHTQKDREWFQSRGLQLPKEGMPRGSRNLRTDAEVVNLQGETPRSPNPMNSSNPLRVLDDAQVNR